MRWGGGRGARADHPPGLTLPLHPAWARRLFPAVAGGHSNYPPSPPHALQLFPSCPAPPQRQLGERLGAESGAQLLSSGAGTREGSDMKEPGPAGVAGGGNPPAVPPCGLRTSGPQEPSVGWGRRAPLLTPCPALPGKGRSDGLPGEGGKTLLAGGRASISEPERFAEGGTGRACGCGGGGVPSA